LHCSEEAIPRFSDGSGVLVVLPKLALYCSEGYSLLLDATQSKLVVIYRRFGITCRFPPQGSSLNLEDVVEVSAVVSEDYSFLAMNSIAM
jgi:hypothetical protein